MTIKPTHLHALARLCHRLGGRLEIVSQDTYNAMFCTRECLCASHDKWLSFADNHGLHWKKKIIYTVQGREQVGALIHEMGHVFAADKAPPDCDEWDWLGWEIAVARRIGAYRAWSQQNDHYCVDTRGMSWGSLSTKHRQRIVTDRVAHARKRGLIGRDGVPRSVR